MGHSVSRFLIGAALAKKRNGLFLCSISRRSGNKWGWIEASESSVAFHDEKLQC